MPYTVYLSSTRKDLEAERAAVQDALKDICVVRHSYLASEDALVQSCLDDVAGCDLYILILGLRYGHVPQGKFSNPDNLSITELEYRHAEGRVPRVVFLKDEDVILHSQTDSKTKEHPPERIAAFRAHAGGGEDQRPAIFATVPELREQVLKAFREFERRNPRPRADVGGGPGASPRAPDHDAVRRGYVAWLAEECEKVLLLGLGARERQNVRLGQVYVPALTTRRDPEARRGRVEPNSRESTLEPLLNRLGRESLYVPGAPGSGKSTFSRWVALSVASGGVPAHAHPVPDEFAEAFPETLRGRFPLLCPLREWSADARWLAGNGQWRRGQLEAALSTVDRYGPAGRAHVRGVHGRAGSRHRGSRPGRRR